MRVPRKGKIELPTARPLCPDATITRSAQRPRMREIDPRTIAETRSVRAAAMRPAFPRPFRRAERRNAPALTVRNRLSTRRTAEVVAPPRGPENGRITMRFAAIASTDGSDPATVNAAINAICAVDSLSKFQPP